MSPGKAKPKVRVWFEVHQVFSIVAKKYNLQLVDLVSSILIQAAMYDPKLVATSLVDWFGIDYVEAHRIAFDLHAETRKILDAWYDAYKSKEVVGSAQEG